MLKNIFVIAILLSSFTLFGQEEIIYTINPGVENKDVQEILTFKNIFADKVDFSGEALIDKFYKVHIKEFKNGKLITNKLLFDSSESDYFKIKSPYFSFKIFSEINDKKLTLQLVTDRYASSKKNYILTESDSSYAIKNFLGFNISKQEKINTEIPLLAIITPYIRKDGSGSYCQVANSGINPDKLGEKFNIPHYFLINVEFFE